MREYCDQPSFGALAREVSGEPGSSWFRSAVGRVGGWFARWRRDRETIRALGRLDDHMLGDIGLDRVELPAAVSRGALHGSMWIVDAFFPRLHRKRE